MLYIRVWLRGCTCACDSSALMAVYDVLAGPSPPRATRNKTGIYPATSSLGKSLLSAHPSCTCDEGRGREGQEGGGRERGEGMEGEGEKESKGKGSAQEEGGRREEGGGRRGEGRAGHPLRFCSVHVVSLAVGKRNNVVMRGRAARRAWGCRLPAPGRDLFARKSFDMPGTLRRFLLLYANSFHASGFAQSPFLLRKVFIFTFSKD
ncbi:hypothetical protein E2C01_036342 [Portunus trituberculatus]|uniref:Uncharacterized protein n=1 Tax=Portunus trituberculatus TaxID=210409 RepID=A0A5B7FB42_PORTR|nr:hypothetical protein [Portunus trituberculatus]